MEKIIGSSEKGKTLADFLRDINPEIKYGKVLGQGGYGLVLKVNQQGKDYRLKISKADAETKAYSTLDKEYSLFEKLAKTGACLKPVELYEGVPAVYVDKSCMPYNFYGVGKGKNAYLTEFLEGKVLSEDGKIPSFSLRMKLGELLDKIHRAGYEFREGSDFNANQILLGVDGSLYLLDPLLLTRRKEEKKGITKEEQARIDTILSMYGED